MKLGGFTSHCGSDLELKLTQPINFTVDTACNLRLQEVEANNKLLKCTVYI